MYEIFGVVLRDKIIVAELEQGLVLAPGASDYPSQARLLAQLSRAVGAPALDQTKRNIRQGKLFTVITFYTNIGPKEEELEYKVHFSKGTNM